MLYVDDVHGSGLETYEAACAGDLEGIVGKLARGLYTPEATTWVKIQESELQPGGGTPDFFDGRAHRAAV